MYYEWEWMSDLAIIPAFEIFLVGILVGICIALIIIVFGNKTGGRKTMNGIDISHYQQGLDVGRLKDAALDFAILKITEGTNLIDGESGDFYMEAKEANIPVGGYCYSHALTADEARAEAAFLVKTLRGFPVPLGLFLDIEEQDQLALPSETLYQIARAWCEEIRGAGYTPGIYGSEGTLFAKINANLLPFDCLVWVAHYGKQPDVPCDLWQSSDSGSAPGYGGPVDTDVVRSVTFERLVRAGWQQEGTEAPAEEPAADACPIFPPDPSVLVIEMVMAYNGYWGKPDGYKTPEFFKALRQFVDDMEAC